MQLMCLVSLPRPQFEPSGLVQGVLPQGWAGHASEGAFDAAGFQDRCQPGWWEAQITTTFGDAVLGRCWDQQGMILPPKHWNILKRCETDEELWDQRSRRCLRLSSAEAVSCHPMGNVSILSCQDPGFDVWPGLDLEAKCVKVLDDLKFALLCALWFCITSIAGGEAGCDSGHRGICEDSPWQGAAMQCFWASIVIKHEEIIEHARWSDGSRSEYSLGPGCSRQVKQVLK